MGDRSGFEWKDMPTNNKVDEFVADKLKRTKTLPSEIASDEDSLRRIHLDLTGCLRPPKMSSNLPKTIAVAKSSATS